MPRVDIAHANAQRLTVFMLNDAAVCREHGEKNGLTWPADGATQRMKDASGALCVLTLGTTVVSMNRAS